MNSIEDEVFAAHRLTPTDRERFLRSELGSGLTALGLAELMAAGYTRVASWPVGSIPFHAAQLQSNFVLLLAGRLQVVRTKPSGNSQILDWVVPGECCGAVTAFTASPHWVADVHVIEDARGLVIDTAALIGRPEDDEVGRLLLRNCRGILASRGLRMTERVELLTYRGLRQRLAFMLLRDQVDGVVQLGVNRQQLADSLYVSRASMTRELGRMADDGLIQVDGRRIELLTQDGLRAALN